MAIPASASIREISAMNPTTDRSSTTSNVYIRYPLSIFAVVKPGRIFSRSISSSISVTSCGSIKIMNGADIRGLIELSPSSSIKPERVIPTNANVPAATSTLADLNSAFAFIISADLDFTQSPREKRIMRKVILSAAISFDGFIEGPSGEIDWITFGDEEGGSWSA